MEKIVVRLFGMLVWLLYLWSKEYRIDDEQI